MTILHYLEKTAAALPDKTAVTDSTGSYTFSQLRGNALLLAVCIKDKLKGQTGNPVLVYLPKSKECIAAFMAVVYSGNMYTPTDIRFPFPKVRSITDVLKPALYITDEQNAAVLEGGGIAKEDILIYNECLSAAAHFPAFDVNRALRDTIDTDPVYTLFTSGSTGVPKGVVICHRSIVDYMEWFAEYYKIDENVIMGSQAPFYFDVSVPDIYLCIKCGAQLHIIPEQLFAFPKKLMETVCEKQINFIFWVPSVFISIANNDILSDVNCTHLKYILFGGEVMPNRQLNYWREHIPGAIYSNLYGPTEITGTCIYYTADRDFDDDEPLPIGVACGNTGAMLVGDDGTLIDKPDIQGQLYIRGSCLSLGYWNNPAMTAEYFVQNPLHNHYPETIYRTGDLAHYNDRGELMFDGRRDFQIKHMGYRIELGEIETAATGVPGISSACADYDKTKQELVLFFAGDTEKKELHKSLLQTIPKYMVPARFVHIGEMPYNDNGKIDRIKLRNKYIT